MKKLALAVIGLALMGGLAVSAPAAFAADTTPCSTALLAQADLDAQVKAADVADKAAADAKAADDAAADARDALKAASDAQFTYSQAPYNDDPSPATAAARVTELRAHQDDVEWVNVADRIAKLTAVISTRAGLAAKQAEALKADADALRREADKTDAADLRVKFAAAVKAATDACKGADGTPIVVTPVPQAPQVVVIPRAIDTGEM